MGRLRDDSEIGLMCGVAAEVTELFGTSDCSLYSHNAALQLNLVNKDPLWDEPTTTAEFVKFVVPCNWFDLQTNAEASESGRDDTADSSGYIALDHLIGAGVPKDENNDYVQPGDVLALHDKCGHETMFFDIVQTNREGWLNSSDKFTGYNLELKRRSKYIPERKV